MDPRVEVKGAEVMAAVDKIAPNKFNYNKQNEKTFSRLSTSMRKFGFIERPIVRELEDGTYEIINGEHRWRAARQAKMEELPVISVGQMSDEEAKQLCIIFNELSGKPDEVRLSELLRDINSIVTTGDLLEVMPYSPSELDMYLSAMDFSFDNLPEKSSKSAEEEAEDELKLKLGWEGEEAEKLMAKLAAIAEDPKDAVELAVDAYTAKSKRKSKAKAK